MANKLTYKQINTLKLFATGYPLHKIATKQKVSLSTVRKRLRNMEHTQEFENACGIRRCYKQSRKNLYCPLSLEDIPEEALIWET